MDIESDDSERWEDFFGSSTDLAPSLLGFYDTLTTTLDGKSNCPLSEERKTQTSSADYNGRHEPDALNATVSSTSADTYLNSLQAYAQKTSTKVSRPDTENVHVKNQTPINSDSCSNSLGGSLESISSAHGTLTKHRTNLRNLSPNVQRIIAHSEGEAVDGVTGNEPLQEVPKETVHHQRYIKKPCPANANAYKLKHSIIPLSKTTGKLTQTSTELMETLSASLNESTESQQGNGGINSLDFSYESAQHGNKLYSNRDLKFTLANGYALNKSLENGVTTKPLEDTANGTRSNIVEFEQASANLSNLSLDVSSPIIVVDAINTPLISKYVTHNIESRPLSYARYKCLTARDVAPKKAVATFSSSLFLPEVEQDAGQVSAESLDRLSEIKSKCSPKEAKKMSTLQLPDKTKLKHRPLSSSSICSTSSNSSSSSGADHTSGKLNTSYLASVESLADHSENELIETHSGMSVFERACMEIVDSERSYVNDLGEVIRGYLLDWKERACLHQNELLVLFSNIEDVYEFNLFLLKHLTDSILDPLKIAKCFIDLKDGFDVYTRYCTSYPGAISLLTKLLQATHTNALLASTQRMLHHTLPLGSYLLKPVQRILKYHLLLDNLRKHCDVKEVMQAYEIMRQVARNIDQVKRKLEQQTRVKELCGILDGWLGPELTVLGELRLEGVLMESNKPRKVLLFATMLIIAKAKEDNRLQFKSYIHQNNLMLSEHLAGEPTSFFVIPYDEPRHQIKLTAKNRDQKRLWTQHIKSVILEKFDNIPLRVKELVYQLGDEEDRTTDKASWKWGLNSTSTPTYLERRNQFRRSEMRNRSKVKRKTISNGASIDIFHESMHKNPTTFLKSISKSAESINEKNLPSLEPSADDVCNNVDCLKGHKCAFHMQEDRGDGDNTKTLRSASKSFRFGGKPLKERSKSVPRISLRGDTIDKTAAEESRERPVTGPECSQITIKTLPKRMTCSLKRQKSKVKETSTFYMDLSEFEDSSNTVLKITESSENILNANQIEAMEASKEHTQLPDVIQKTEDNVITSDVANAVLLTPSEKAKLDAQIVFDLLRNSKEFDKLCSMLQKKRSLDKNVHSVHLKAPEQQSQREKLDSPPRPPSRSPPPLDTAIDCYDLKPLQHDMEEPIYETLLRNVHVPYKFSPVLGRSRSAQCPKNREENHNAPRPESDYVTLVYTAEGVLKNIDDEEVKLQHDVKDRLSSSLSTVTLTRDSSETEQVPEHHAVNVSQQMSASFHGSSDYSQTRSHTPKSLLRRLWSHSSLAAEESHATASSRSIVVPERKERNSVLHLQGSDTIGERIAHVDYADPRTLFPIYKRDAVYQLQRDSVFSLTSSNDSGCESKSVETAHLPGAIKFNYEDSVEASLENDFRDSAIYSDDNERWQDKTHTQPMEATRNPPLKPKPLYVPPLPLAKRPISRVTSVEATSNPTPTQVLPGLIMCPLDMSPSSTRSWVLQQIDNFSK